MASNRLLAVLLAGFALTAVSAGTAINPCSTPPPKPVATTTEPCTPVKPGLSNAEIAGITVGTAAGAAAIIGGAVAGSTKEEAEPPTTEAPLPVTTIKKRADVESTTTTVAVEEGSSSSDIPIWAWITIGVVSCLCVSGLVFMLTQKKTVRKKKKSKAKPAAAEPVAAAADPEVQPLMEVPPLMPMGTTSLLQPSYSVVAAPATTAYMAAPAMTTAAPVVYEQAMAAPVVYEQVAAPVQYAAAAPVLGTATYAAPTAFAAPVAYSQYAAAAPVAYEAVAIQ